MTPAIEFLEKQDIEHKSATRSEIAVRICPSCGNDNWKLYVNKDKGVFHCKVCGNKGGLHAFKAMYGVMDSVASAKDLIGGEFKHLEEGLLERMHEDLLNNIDAMNYLRGRNFTDETIRFFQLGYKSDNDGEWIAIPHIQDGQLWNVKYRRFAGGDKTFKRVKGQPTMLFNIDNVDYSKGGIMITEAELDAVAAHQMGVKNVVSLTAGADTFKPEWLRVFSEFKTVFVCLDSDEPGQKGAKKIAEKIGLKKAKNIILPTKDVNELMSTDIDAANVFKGLIGNATRFEIQNVSSASELVNRLDEWFDGDDSGLAGVSTGFEQLDALTKGLKAQDLVVLSGDSGIGKTTFMLNIMNELIQPAKDVPVLGFFLEGQLEYYFSRMLGMELGIPYDTLRDDSTRWENVKKKASEFPFYYYSGSQGTLNVEELREIVKTCVNLYDVRVIFIDNLQKLVRGADNLLHQRVGEAVSILKDICVDLKVTVVLIAHIRKRDPNQALITMHDAKSSSTIYQDSDSFWILQMLKDEYILSVDKNRMGPGGKQIYLKFDNKIGKFTETGEVAEEHAGQVPVINKKKSFKKEIA